MNSKVENAPKNFTFKVTTETVVNATDLDDAIAQLDAAGHNVDDLSEVRWLD